MLEVIPNKGGKGGINVNPDTGLIASATDQIRSAQIQLPVNEGIAESSSLHSCAS
jgi:hypothetical protein